MFTAVRLGWWPALVAAVLAFLSYNFFFVEPFHTFSIYDPDEWLALLIFLAVAAVTSNLAASERARRQDARRLADEALMLYELSRSLSGGGSDAALGEFCARLTEALGLQGCAILVNDAEGRARTLVSHGAGAEDDAAGQVLGRPGGRHRHLGRWIRVKGRPADHRLPGTVGAAARRRALGRRPAAGWTARLRRPRDPAAGNSGRPARGGAGAGAAARGGPAGRDPAADRRAAPGAALLSLA